MERAGPNVSEQAAIAAANLRRDAVAVEVVDALREAGVDAIVLKGPTLAHWLGDDLARPYVDCDLLVQEPSLPEARRLLADLGFAPYLEGADLGERWAHPAWMWSRGDDRIDLHHGLAGAHAAPELLWNELRTHTVGLRRGRSELTILDAPAAALVLALHAAQHGTGEQLPLRDLRVAVERLELSVWDEAAQLAERLGATGAFAAGLRLVPDGDRLAPEATPSVAVALSSASAPPQALALEQLASAPGARGKLAYLGRRLAPPGAWMRASYPLARRGRLGLATAYAWRVLSAPARLVHSVPAWRQARRRAAA